MQALELRTALIPTVLAALLSVCGSVYAQEAPRKSNPWATFNFGYNAYQKGDKEQAFQAFRDAADQGEIRATWKLGHMYAAGDGIPQDDYAAYQLFSEVVRRGAEPGSQEQALVRDAYEALAKYAANGIPNSPVLRDPELSRNYLADAAPYGSAAGQFELGREYLEQSKKQPSRLKLAARWLNRAAANGHVGARALLGDLLFRSGKAVEGLAMMTEALRRASPSDQVWITQMQEEAFAVTDEETRRRAIEKADRRLSVNN